jgi:membrane protein DedA with SNARE-associated domain
MLSWGFQLVGTTLAIKHHLGPGIWNYGLLVILVILEGPIATLAGATIAARGLMNPVLVFILASASNFFADTLWYLLGYMGANHRLLRHLRRLGVQPEHIEQLRQQMNRHALKILLVAKLTLSFSIPALIAAGLSRVPWRRAVSVLLPAECLWTGCLVLGGYYFSQFIKRLEQGVQIICILGILAFVLLVIRYLRKRLGPLNPYSVSQYVLDPSDSHRSQDLD